MARIRSIKPDFWTDEKIVNLSPLARLLFIGMWNFVDDSGRCEYSPVRLKMQILPADSADIQELLGEIRGESLIHVYTVNNKQYFQVCGFNKHQKIDKRSPSKIPPPSESLRIPPTELEVEVNKYLEKEKKIIKKSFLDTPMPSTNTGAKESVYNLIENGNATDSEKEKEIAEQLEKIKLENHKRGIHVE